jgi:energy-coupling factor transporter ATP-binding protein EcfA2
VRGPKSGTTIQISDRLTCTIRSDEAPKSSKGTQMEKLKISLENCYGIQRLEYEFDFTKSHQCAIYAPNGAMKSSLAKCFQDVENGHESKDRIFPEREPKRVILADGVELAAENVFVIEPYNEAYKSDRISTLLVNKALRQRYDEVRKKIDAEKDALVKELGTLAGFRPTAKAEEVLSEDVSQDPKQFFISILRLRDEVNETPYPQLASLTYNKIFTPKAEEVMASKEFRAEITRYMEIYEKLTSNSSFFKKGVFDHNNASDVATNLKKNGFFDAEHSVYVNNKDVRQEIKTEIDLIKYIDIEKNTIIEDAELRGSFDKIDKILIKNADTRLFRDYISQNEVIIPELERPDRLKQRLWISYLAKHGERFKNTVDIYQQGKEQLDKIIEEARKEATRWSQVLAEFNERFSVPFVVTMENQEDVILRSEAPSVAFRFKDRDGTKKAVTETDLMRTLSTGEKRALYILNVIWEVMARQDSETETLFVLDDIADSFDYKNKYAIVEYLRDISEKSFFYQLVLTHNYDFYRTFSGRVGLHRTQKLHAIKDANGIILKQEKYQNNPFKHWREQIPLDANYDFLLASIPLFRNIAEYAGDQHNEERLTKFLHIQDGTSDLTIDELKEIIEAIATFPAPLSLARGNEKFLSVLFERAEAAKQLDEEAIELESKIVLSIAIRLKAESYVISEIANDQFVNSLTKNQTFALSKKFVEMFPERNREISVLNKVNLMTPENIHLNSFMYEPILDMANLHLKRLYDQVCALGTPDLAAFEVEAA